MAQMSLKNNTSKFNTNHRIWRKTSLRKKNNIRQNSWQLRGEDK
jgi:hypothetical protein